MDTSKIEFRVAGANQDATSTRRCDLSQDPSNMNGFFVDGKLQSTKNPFMLAYIYIPYDWIRHGCWR